MHGNVKFSVYLAKLVFFLPTNILLPFCRKNKDDLPKNALKDDTSCIIEKDATHPRKYSISSDRKIKDDEKVYSVKFA